MRAGEWSLGCYWLMYGLLVVSTTRLVVQVHGCSWAGHCAGDPCQTYNDCDGSLVCIGGKCGSPTPPPPGCSWADHCAGDPCQTYNDCDGDLTCISGKCGSSTAPPTIPSPNLTKSTVNITPDDTSTPPSISPIPSPNPPTVSAPSPPPSSSSGLTEVQKIAAIVGPIATVVGVAVTVAYTGWKWYHKRKAKAQVSGRSSGSLPSVTPQGKP